MKLKRSAGAVAALIAAIASLAVLAPLTQAATPAKGYEKLAGCPSAAENPATAICVRSVITGGHFQMGSKDVPIKNPITLVGGLNAEGAGFSANSKGGLAAVKQQVPGGIIGLTGLDWLVNFLSLEGLKLYAVTELVGAPALGENLELPIRVHLINPVLGNNCYVGSPATPIKLVLTEHTTSPPAPNKPISGKEAEFSIDESTSTITFNNAVAVDNSFAAPGASGCVLTLFGFIPISINGLVNSTSGLPSPAGTNETVQNMNTELVPREVVYP